MPIVITFGTFDLFHYGHLRILERAKHRAGSNGKLIVGVSSDKLTELKGKKPIIPLDQRLSIVRACKYVDEVFIEESLELKAQYIKKYHADILIMGDDWKNKFDDMPCKVIYLPRTPLISTSDLKKSLRSDDLPVTLLLCDVKLNSKHRRCMAYLLDYWDKCSHIKYIYWEDNPHKYSAQEIDAVITLNVVRDIDQRVAPEVPRILLDHGLSVLKWFLIDQPRARSTDFFLCAGRIHKQILDTIHGSKVSHKTYESVYVNSPALAEIPTLTRSDLHRLYRFKPNIPIICYCPTWTVKNPPESIINDYTVILQQLSTLKNCNVIISPHVGFSKKMLDYCKQCNINISQSPTQSIIKCADIVISDTSSVLNEAAYLGIPAIQLLMSSYTDNWSFGYRLPLIAGTIRYARLGLLSVPNNLAHNVKSLLNEPQQASYYQAYASKWGNISNNSNEILTSQICQCIRDFRYSPRLQRPYEWASPWTKRQRLVDFLTHYQTKIIHSGGQINGFKYTCSRDALLNCIKYQQYLVEVDTVLSSDGVIIAHDNLEHHYGFTSRKFSQITTQEFLQAKCHQQFTTMSFETMLDLLVQHPKLKMVLDIKGDNAMYKRQIDYIVPLVERKSQQHQCNLWQQLVPQVYNTHNLQLVILKPFYGFVFAIWKQFDHIPLSPLCLNEIHRAMAMEPHRIMAISLRLIRPNTTINNTKDPNISKLLTLGPKVFIHGVTKLEAERPLLNNHFGLFSHYPDVN